MTEITGPEALARVAELVEDIDFTMLTTTDPDGNLVSRPAGDVLEAGARKADAG